VDVDGNGSMAHHESKYILYIYKLNDIKRREREGGREGERELRT